MKQVITIIMTTGGAVLGFLFGDWTGVLIALLFFIVADYITGVVNAIVNKCLSSDKGFKGLLRKVVILLVVSIGHMIDHYILGGGAMVRDACIFFYISNEGISILENIVGMGVPVPEKLRVILEQLKEEDDGNEETD